MNGDTEHQRGAYFRLAVYHGRSISILRSALNTGKEPLARAAMRNLATLHRATPSEGSDCVRPCRAHWSDPDPLRSSAHIASHASA